MGLILASGSPRRLELIGRIVPSYRSLASPVEEAGSTRKLPFEIPPLFLSPPFPVPPEQDPRLWAWRKAIDVIESHRDAVQPGSFVLAADTVVVGPGRLLNKPKDREEAIEMLSMLRGIYHYVVTGFAILRAGERHVEPETLHHQTLVSTVFMRDFSDLQLQGYVATDEPYDKAGAYALQGEGGALVSSVEGCLTNVIGLPLCAARRALAACGAEVLPYPYGGFCEHCSLVGA